MNAHTGFLRSALIRHINTSNYSHRARLFCYCVRLSLHIQLSKYQLLYFVMRTLYLFQWGKKNSSNCCIMQTPSHISIAYQFTVGNFSIVFIVFTTPPSFFHLLYAEILRFLRFYTRDKIEDSSLHRERQKNRKQIFISPSRRAGCFIEISWEAI